VGVALMFGGPTFVHLALLPGRAGLVMARRRPPDLRSVAA
jgi:hypothetical protein